MKHNYLQQFISFLLLSLKYKACTNLFTWCMQLFIFDKTIAF